MIFADKVIRLRKRNGWSQEELAERLDTSRQAVSKWEGAQSVPDIGKIIQLAQLFGVTTDYLLKDEIENEEYSDGDNEPSVRHVTLAEAGKYLDERREAAKKIAVATFLCILSPIPIMLLGAASENIGVSERLATAVGSIALLVIAAVAVAIYVLSGFKNAPYEFLEKEPFIIEYGVKGMVQERRKAFQKTYVNLNVTATCLCVLAPVLLFIGQLHGNDLFMVIMLSMMMVTAGIGTALFILAGVRMASMQRLLSEGEYSIKKKKSSGIKEAISTVYWLLTVTVFLTISFVSDSWKTSWIVWPVAGVLYAAVMAAADYIISKKNND